MFNTKGKLSKDIFELLVYIDRNKKLSKNQLIEYCKHMGINTLSIDRICSDGYVAFDKDEMSVSKEGFEALQPYRVKRAVILAAGFGSRMVPITINTPKPLVRVNGKMIVETLLDAISEAEIEEVYLIRGYLWEQFDTLLYKYPNIKFILNDKYNEANNISSALLGSEYMKNAYVMEADLLINNPYIVRKYEYSTNYLGRYCDYTDDWCFDVENGIIKKLNIGGNSCYHMYGISYWTEDDAEKLKKCIENVFETDEGKQKYWDEVALRIFKDEFEVSVRPCFDNDIIEIDTFKELVELDARYKI